jgi:putative ABC transport system permease protein
MTLLQDLRFASRLLVKDRWFTLVAAVTLALGIGANTTVFTIVYGVLIRGLPFDRSEDLVYLATRDTTQGADDSSPVSWREFQDWRDKAKTFEQLAAFRTGQVTLSDADRPAERFNGALVTANLFTVIRQQPVLGRDFMTGEDAAGATPVAMIGYRVWANRYSSDPNIIGRSIKINEVAYTVGGVMPEGMRFPTNADVWRPLPPVTDLEASRNRNVNVFGRLAPGVSWAQAAAEMRTISIAQQGAYPDTNRNIEARLMTFNERYNGGRIRTVLFALLGAVGSVLLIACANVANLLLARSAFRAREMAVRTALGATRWRIIRQLLIESVMLACIGGVFGLGLAAGGVRAFAAAVARIEKPYWIRFEFDWSVLGYFALICLATGIVFGLAPAFQVSRTNLNDLMKEGGRGTAGGRRARWLTSTLVVAELTLTLALLTGAGLMTRSFLKLYAVELGIDTSHLLTLRTQLLDRKYPTPDRRYQFFETLQTRLGQIPGVSMVAVATTLPSEGTGTTTFEIEGQPADRPERRPRVGLVDISSTYFDTLATPVRRGRGLQPHDGQAGADVVVINERLAAQLPAGMDPIGRRIRIFTGKDNTPGPWLTIVGVSSTIRQGDSRDLEPSAVMYRPYRVSSPAGLAILVRTQNDPALATNAVRQMVQTIDPDQPVFAIKTLDELVAEPRYPYSVFGTLFVVFGVIGLVMSAVGIYAVTAYSVTQRTQEIGVRLALGARTDQISWLILRSGLLQLSIGLGLGLLAAYGVGNVLKTLIVQIPATDPVTFVSITLLLTLVTIVACLLPALRATRLDPLAALRVD